jgi:hypothetical protein
MANYKKYGFIGVLRKPFLIEELQELLYKHLPKISKYQKNKKD